MAVTVTTITATPASLTFLYQLGPAAKLPASQSVALKSSQVGLVVTVAVTGDLNGSWLTPSVRPGNTITMPGSFTVNVTPTSLAAGSYAATITLTGVDTLGTTVAQTIAVTLVVVAPPSQLDFSPTAGLTFNHVTGTGAPANQQFLMYSEGGPLSVTLSVSAAPWLKLNPTGSVQVGGLFMPIVVSIDSAELAKLTPKVYTANITVSAPNATNKSSTYPITLNVTAAKPRVTDTWPQGIVQSAAGTGSTTIVIDGNNFFDTSTVAVSGFTSSTVVTVTDSTASPLSGSATFSIPVYPTGASFLRLTMGSPLPTGYALTAYSQDLSVGGVAGGSGTYTWSATGLDNSNLTLSAAGLLSGTSPTPGDYHPVITVTDTVTGASAYMPFSLTIYPTATPPTTAVWVTVGTVLPSATVGAPYTTNVVVAGGTGPYQWAHSTATPFPAGLDIDTPGSTVAIHGTPTSVGATGSLTQKRLSDGALQVTIPNTYLTRLGFLRMTVTTPTPGGGISNEAHLELYGPEPRILGVGNAASYAAGSASPGELISIFGTGLGPATLAAYDPNANPLQTALPSPAPPAGVTQVWFSDGTTSWLAPLIFTSAGQLGAMVPFEVGGLTAATVTVSYAGLFSAPFQLAVTAAVPGIFSADASGRGQGAILNYIAASGDYTLNSATNPAILKNAPIVVLYVTGFGATTPPSTTNHAAGATVDTAIPASVTIDGKAAASLTAVPQGSFPGLLQLNVTVPSDATAGKAVPVTVSFNGVNAQNGVTLALK